MTAEQRNTLRKLAEAATPGPWIAERDDSHFDSLSTICAGLSTAKWPHRELIVQVGGSQNIARQEGTTRYIAAADPATILSLLDYIDTLEKDVARYQWLRSHDDWDGRIVMLYHDDYAVAQGDTLDTAIDAAMGEAK